MARSLASITSLCGDVLLKDVSHAFARLVFQDLLPLMGALSSCDQLPRYWRQLASQLLLLQWRSRHVLQEFAEFYTARLLLDQQSPLATYFIDLFSQLEWIQACFHPIFRFSGDNLHRLQNSLDSLLSLVIPALNTCRLLYKAYRLLPKSGSTCEQTRNERIEAAEFKREGRDDRRFSWNELHCRIRKFGFVNLDMQGPTKVNLRESLGQGASATVYKGVFETDDGNGRGMRVEVGDPVAVKMFSNGSSSDSFGSQLLQSMEHVTQHHEHKNSGAMQDDQLSWELRRLVSLRHPNIVTPKGYIGKRPQGECGLVMEAMDESLHDYLEKVNNGSVPPLKELDMLDLMLEIAKGMRFLHECNLVHRDLKPKNVLLRFCTDHEDLGCQLWEVKLADFGLAKLCDFAQHGQTTAFQGTSCYMAPELRVDSPSQGLSHQLEKVDVFSYGTTCFNILISNPDACAFTGSVPEFYEIVKTGEWKKWVQGIDTHLRYFVELIARCWETEPALRPTFAELCVLLLHAMQFRLSDPNVVGHTLQAFERLYEREYSLVYRSIISDGILRVGVFIGGLKVLKRCFLDFDNLQANSPPNHKKLFLGLARQLYYDNSRSLTTKNLSKVSWKRLVGKHSSLKDITRELYLEVTKDAESPPLKFDKLPSLLFIERLACNNLLLDYSSDASEDSLLLLYERGGEFDFKSDGAFCDLEVDTSLIPLLVLLWILDWRLRVNYDASTKGSR